MNDIAMPHSHGRDYAALVDDLFCRPQSSFRGFTRRDQPMVLVDGLLVRARLERHSTYYDLTVYDGIENLAGELWERSAKTMLRLRALRHPALPVIETARQLPDERVAFTLTEDRGGPLVLDQAVMWATEAPVEAFEQFSLLLDGLKKLHGARTMHRLMLPTAFRWRSFGESRSIQLSLSRFEMSGLLSNIIRRVVSGDADLVRETVRQLYLTPAGDAPLDSLDGARHLAYLAPELHPYLFDETHRSRREWDTTDVFGLGVLGWELFCGGLPATLPDELAAVAAAKGTARIRALADLHAAMRAALRAAAVPEALSGVLATMIAAEPSGRDTTYNLSSTLTKSWDVVRGTWEKAVDTPYLVAFMPDESAGIYNERHWISRHPRDAAGREELRLFFQDELREAELVYALNGAQGYASGNADTLAEAKWVLIGKRAVWFCAYLQDRELGGGIKKEFRDTLVIKYLREHNLARELYGAHPRRRVPAIDLVAFFPGQSLADKRVGRPSWADLTTSVTRGDVRDQENENFLRSLDFLLDYQRVEQEARTYPYLAEQPSAGIAELRIDDARDDAWRQRNHLMAAYCGTPGRRPALGDFASSLDDGRGWTEFNLDGRLDRPGFTGSSPKVQYSGRLDAGTITVTVPAGVNVPSRGWLRPATDSGAIPQLRRQIRARQSLEAQPTLVSELRIPRSMEIGQHHWDVDPEQNLLGNTPGIIRNMLSRLPLYALQGPPGSGKTTAVANALKLFLADERGAKVLVSAQSNFALDNLAERLIKVLDVRSFVILREVSQRAVEDRVAAPVQRFTLEQLSRDTYDDVQAAIATRLRHHEEGELDADRNRRLTATELQITRDWGSSVESNQFELADRLRNGASVVLATCSVAANTLDDSASVTDSFDWVIVEEAAKAWPTELIVPLTLGNRWTLVGDHRQLGAHRSEDVETFLESLRDHPNEKVRVHHEERTERLEVLNLFRTLFAERAVPESEDDVPGPVRLADDGEQLGRLEMQFRMHSAIAEPVRRVFYRRQPVELDERGLWKSFLESSPSTDRPHSVTVPRYLRDRALVWLDTAGYPDCVDHPMWFNEGEVTLVDRLVSAMRPAAAPPGDDGPGSLAVLTPYAKQKEKLEGRDSLHKRVFTVHSFQGREADRVVVSLVRTNRVADDHTRNVGHVGRDEVANVLLSRARRLLVLVGNFAHYRDNGGPTWRDITTLVKHFGDVVGPDEWAAT